MAIKSQLNMSAGLSAQAPDYTDTDNVHGAPCIHRYMPDIWPLPLTLNLMLTFTFDLDLRAKQMMTNCIRKTRFIWPVDLDLWPTTLTYIPTLAKIRVDFHAKDEDCMSNSSTRRLVTDRHDQVHHPPTLGLINGPWWVACITHVIIKLVEWHIRYWSY